MPGSRPRRLLPGSCRRRSRSSGLPLRFRRLLWRTGGRIRRRTGPVRRRLRRRGVAVGGVCGASCGGGGLACLVGAGGGCVGGLLGRGCVAPSRGNGLLRFAGRVGRFGGALLALAAASAARQRLACALAAMISPSSRSRPIWARWVAVRSSLTAAVYWPTAMNSWSLLGGPARAALAAALTSSPPLLTSLEAMTSSSVTRAEYWPTSMKAARALPLPSFRAILEASLTLIPPKLLTLDTATSRSVWPTVYWPSA
ncbi:hypothetical protein SAMN05444921_102162 [Streptomyces wuyuanensis]|uniref:Uncharacterized protein n=1 Tax=Streptomyces wuyuanensis TaxID=1196353 RepID=A0A1G9NXS7_9ACTN|nr:hypothetical protein SAMN05444921_102162 [Streptomyces wuyuanensis]